MPFCLAFAITSPPSFTVLDKEDSTRTADFGSFCVPPSTLLGFPSSFELSDSLDELLAPFPGVEASLVTFCVDNLGLGGEMVSSFELSSFEELPFPGVEDSGLGALCVGSDLRAFCGCGASSLELSLSFGPTLKIFPACAFSVLESGDRTFGRFFSGSGDCSVSDGGSLTCVRAPRARWLALKVVLEVVIFWPDDDPIGISPSFCRLLRGVGVFCGGGESSLIRPKFESCNCEFTEFTWKFTRSRRWDLFLCNDKQEADMLAVIVHLWQLERNSVGPKSIR